MIGGISSSLTNIVSGGEKMPEGVDWNAISAISNIILSLLTFIGLMITLYFSVKNSFYKLEISYQIDDKWRMKVVNTRNVPVNLMACGFVYKDNENRFISVSKYIVPPDKKRLEWNQVVRRITTEVDLQNNLYEAKLPLDKSVLIYAFVKTENGKMYKKRIKRIYPRQKEEPILTLNKQ
ncbi:hypothetical protein ABZ756_02190 [Mammaliicoccus sciuri]